MLLSTTVNPETSNKPFCLRQIWLSPFRFKKFQTTRVHEKIYGAYYSPMRIAHKLCSKSTNQKLFILC